jgi:hypothetical protein
MQERCAYNTGSSSTNSTARISTQLGHRWHPAPIVIFLSPLLVGLQSCLLSPTFLDPNECSHRSSCSTITQSTLAL